MNLSSGLVFNMISRQSVNCGILLPTRISIANTSGGGMKRLLAFNSASVNFPRNYHRKSPRLLSCLQRPSSAPQLTLLINKSQQQMLSMLMTSSFRWKHTGGGSDNNEVQQHGSLPALMPFPPIVWPRFINAVRNWFFITFIIKPYFDKEFSPQEFLIGAKEAVSVVANKLSEGKLDDLEGMVDPTALAEIRQSLSKFTVFQQQLLRVAVDDIFFAFPYQVGIIIPDEPPRDQYPEGVKPPPQTRHVEITVCLHVLRGLAEKHKRGEVGSAFNFQEYAKDERNKLNVMVCNYRFFRDFTEGNPDPSWIINMVNHFLPMEMNQK